MRCTRARKNNGVKHFLFALFAIGLIESQDLAAGDAPTAPRPNVVLILVDDLKPLLGCYGDTVVRSPNIDRLAARGTLFESAYCNQAVCSPSRNALLTGLRPQTLGIYDLATNFRASVPDAITLPQHFRQHGYRTEALGKVFHAGHANHDDAASWSVPHFSGKGRAAGEQGDADPQASARPAAQNARSKKRGLPFTAADVDDSAYADGKVADEAVRRLQAAQAKPEEPFFLAVGFVKPHLPFVAPQKYWDLYPESAFEFASWRNAPVGAPSYAGQNSGELRRYRGVPAQGALPDDLQRKLIHGYHAATSYMDAQVGRVIAALDQTGLAENTIVVFWGDHGWHLGDHGMWCKQTNYEQAARIPLIVVAPQIAAAGTRTKALAESVDVYPTLCELAGLPLPRGADGLSLANVLRKPESAGKESIIHVYPRGERIGRAIRTPRYRLVEWKTPNAPPATAELELYDYVDDPLETKNLAAEQPKTVAALRAILDTHPEAKPQITVDRSAALAPSAPAAN